jgi:hypothetical protein
MGFGVIAASLVLAVGGLLAGWNLWNMLTSSTALLIYTIVFGIAIVAVFKYFIDRDSR